MLSVLLALAAAAFYAVGWVLQQREAAAESERPSLSPALLLHLVRRPAWLVGIAAMVAGNVLQGAALTFGSLTLVEPVLVTSLLLALPLGAAMSRQRLHRREWTAAIAVSVGVAVLLIVGAPTAATHVGQPFNWVLAGAAAAGASAVVVLLGLRTGGVARAVLFASAAGMLFGLEDAITKSLFDRIDVHGITTVFTSWQTYGVLATAIYGLLLAQDAYKSAPLPASLPPLTVGEPIIGIAVGIVVLGERFNISGLAPVWEIIAVVAMVWGSYALAESPLVMAEQRVQCEEAGPRPPGCEPARAATRRAAGAAGAGPAEDAPAAQRRAG